MWRSRSTRSACLAEFRTNGITRAAQSLPPSRSTGSVSSAARTLNRKKPSLSGRLFCAWGHRGLMSSTIRGWGKHCTQSKTRLKTAFAVLRACEAYRPYRAVRRKTDGEAPKRFLNAEENQFASENPTRSAMSVTERSLSDKRSAAFLSRSSVMYFFSGTPL